MRCPRCHGMMVAVNLDDADGPTHQQLLAGWRCLQCGEVVDPVIMQNRRTPHHPSKNRARLPCGVVTGPGGKPKSKANSARRS